MTKPRKLTPEQEMAYHLEMTLRGVREGKAFSLATARRWLASGQMLAALEECVALMHADNPADGWADAIRDGEAAIAEATGDKS